ncbi:SDR family NAD(P)-dependent oxidoreductase, partial [Nocardioides sp. NPDC057764]
MRINLSGAFYMTKAVRDHMAAKQFGRIVNINSVVGETGMRSQAPYAASKSGMVGFTKSLAPEVAQTRSPSTASHPAMFSQSISRGCRTLFAERPMTKPRWPASGSSVWVSVDPTSSTIGRAQPGGTTSSHNVSTASSGNVIDLRSTRAPASQRSPVMKPAGLHPAAWARGRSSIEQWPGVRRHDPRHPAARAGRAVRPHPRVTQGLELARHLVPVHAVVAWRPRASTARRCPQGACQTRVPPLCQEPDCVLPRAERSACSRTCRPRPGGACVP